MYRFALFVDGSNLSGSLRAMNVNVHDYQGLFRYVFRETKAAWITATAQDSAVPTQLRRIYWYVVGSMDEWDLALPQSQAALRGAWERDRAVHDDWMQATGRENPGLPTGELEDRAWAACFADFRSWYKSRRKILADRRRFYQGVRIATDLIDVNEDGHWKIDFIRKAVHEKGLDTSLAVDMVALEDQYDVAVVVSGDADAIPSIRHLKNRDKHIAAVEFVNGSPPEAKGRSFSSRLKGHADFVTRIYETELLRLKVAQRPDKRSTATQLE